MPTSNAPHEASQQVSQGTRGPQDDFFCQKYQVWYRVRDCVYRGRNKTFAGCENCFQGFLNIKRLESGRKPAVFADAAPSATGASNAIGGDLVPFAPPRDR